MLSLGITFIYQHFETPQETAAQKAVQIQSLEHQYADLDKKYELAKENQSLLHRLFWDSAEVREIKKDRDDVGKTLKSKYGIDLDPEITSRSSVAKIILWVAAIGIGGALLVVAAFGVTYIAFEILPIFLVAWALYYLIRHG